MEIEHLKVLLAIAEDHLRQYREYAEEMRKIGRGMRPSSEYSPEWLAASIDGTLRPAPCCGHPGECFHGEYR